MCECRVVLQSFADVAFLVTFLERLHHALIVLGELPSFAADCRMHLTDAHGLRDVDGCKCQAIEETLVEEIVRVRRARLLALLGQIGLEYDDLPALTRLHEQHLPLALSEAFS